MKQKKTYVSCEIAFAEMFDSVLAASGNIVVGEGIKWPGAWSEVMNDD
ncbi:MAG: hypothetical protein IJA88_06465 [Clostridia bacterium]|nr:hypothetical protein [Clostridia bacterium]